MQRWYAWTAPAVLLWTGAAAAQAPEPTAPPPAEPPPGLDESVEEPPQPAIPFEALDDASQPAAPPAAGGASGPARADTGLRDRVEAMLRASFPALADGLTVDAGPAGVVEVRGAVPLLADKLALSDAVAALPEADIVINRVETAAPRRSDRAITREVRRRLRADDDLRAYDIDVATQGQRVFLTGKVPSYLSVESALREAAGVKGVKDVIVSRLETAIPGP